MPESDAHKLVRLTSLLKDHSPLVSGKTGALPRDFRGNLTFESYITSAAALPAAPARVDRISKVSTFPMYCNDQFGCCTVASIFHLLACLTAFSGDVPGGVMFSDAEVLKVYAAVCPGFNPATGANDNGATLQSVMAYGAKTGFVDTEGKTHKIAAYAEIGDPTNTPLLKKITNTFGGAYLAFNLPQSAENQFPKPWTWVKGSPSVGGHAVPLEYSAEGTGDLNDETLISWGAAVQCNEAFMKHQCVEGIVVITEDWIAANGKTIEGLNLSQLVTDSKAV